MNRKASPLLIWILFLLIGGVGLCSAIVYSRTTTRLQQLTDKEMTRIRSVNFDPAKLNVLILGNSLTQCAFPSSDKELAKSLNENFSRSSCSGTEVQVANLAYSGSGLIYLGKYIDRIFATNPDILVVQVDLVVPWQEISGVQKLSLDFLNVSNLIRPVVTTNIRKFTKSIRRPFYSFLPQTLKASQSDSTTRAQAAKTKSNKTSDTTRPSEVRPEFGAAEEMERKQNVLELGPTKTKEVLSFSRQVIQKALQKGIPVIVLETPRSFDLTSHLKRNVYEERREVVKTLFAPHRPVYFQFPRVLPDNYFEDSRHLNISGMRLFLPWFSETFVREHLMTHSCRN